MSWTHLRLPLSRLWTILDGAVFVLDFSFEIPYYGYEHSVRLSSIFDMKLYLDALLELDFCV